MHKLIDEFIKILEEMPTGYSFKLRIGENEYALKQIKKIPENRYATMEDIKQHNIEVNGWDEGYKAAIEKIKKWRNEQYLKLKKLS